MTLSDMSFSPAVTQDKKKLQKVQFANKANIYIFSASGQAISTIKVRLKSFNFHISHLFTFVVAVY